LLLGGTERADDNQAEVGRLGSDDDVRKLLDRELSRQARKLDASSGGRADNIEEMRVGLLGVWG
jgi:hypothetical protein